MDSPPPVREQRAVLRHRAQLVPLPTEDGCGWLDALPLPTASLCGGRRPAHHAEVTMRVFNGAAPE